MADPRAVAVTGVIVLSVGTVLTICLCVLCKYCLTSKRAQQWSGLSKVLIKETVPPSRLRDKFNTMISDESQFMLKMHQGHYVGYDSLEQDMSLPKFSTSSRETRLKSSAHSTSSGTSSRPLQVHSPTSQLTTDSDTTVDMTNLKSVPVAVDRSRLHCSYSDPSKLLHDFDEEVEGTEPRVIIRTGGNKAGRARHHSFHNSYTIYEESDLSEAESGVVDGGPTDSEEDELHPSVLQGKAGSTSSVNGMSSVNGSSSRNSSVGSSNSCESFSSTLDLLEQHIESSELGQVEYTLAYHRENEQMVLHIIQARQLQLPDTSGGDRLDCFIKSFATHSDGAEPKKQTRVCKATANPIFKENFLFRFTPSLLSTQTITMQILSRDRYARQKLIGEILVDLSPLTITNTYRTWANILDYDHRPGPYCANINVGLSYSSQYEQLEVTVKELSSLRLESSPVYQYKDLYLVLTLVSGADKPVEKFQTAVRSVQTSCQSIEFERATIIFRDIREKSILDYRLVIEVRQQFPDRSHDTLGYNILGSGSTGREYGHWLLACQNQTQRPVFMLHRALTTPQRLKYKPRFKLRL